MGTIELTEAFLVKIAGWQAVKDARSLLASNRVLSSNWTPPLLKGVVQAGETSLRSGLVIKSATDIENICSCRASREWGTLCAHSTAVGLHLLKPAKASPPTNAGGTAPVGSGPASTPPAKPVSEIQRAAPGESGDLLELFLILPPNFEQTVVRGKIMLYLEAKTGVGRVPLNSIAKHRTYSLDAFDAGLLDRLEPLTQGQAPGVLQVPASAFADMLPALEGHPRITLGRNAPVRVEKQPFSPPIRATLQSNGEIVLESAAKSAPLVLIDNRWVWHQNTLRPMALTGTLLHALQQPQKITRQNVPQFLSQEWPGLEASGNVQANFSLQDFQLEPQPPKFILNLAGGLAQLTAQLQCQYGPRILTVGISSRDESLWMPSPDSPTKYSTRDSGSEQAALARLLRCGFSGPDGQGRYQLLGQDRVLVFFAREYPKMRKEWAVSLEERLERITFRHEEGDLEF